MSDNNTFEAVKPLEPLAPITSAEDGAPLLSFRSPVTQNVQLSKKICFWHNPRTDHIMQGAPENFPAPPGYLTIVCNHAWEAEKWSARLNDQDKRRAEMTEYQQFERESAMLADARKQIRVLQDRATSPLNRQMLAFAMHQCDLIEERLRKQMGGYQSFLHVEAHENGK